MFKTDDKTLEQLSFRFSERDIANFAAILTFLKERELLTLPCAEYERIQAGLAKIGQLKLSGKVYAFHVSDSMAWRESNDGEGIELYLRQGDRLEEFFAPRDRDYVVKVDECAAYLRKNNVGIIYTGPLDSVFLGLAPESDPEEPITYRELRQEDIANFEKEKIKVITLDKLI